MVQEGSKETTVSQGGESGRDQPVRTRRLAPHFVDEVTSITLSPNGACRIYFASWSVETDGAPLRIDSELIVTRATLEKLATALQGVTRQAPKHEPVSGADSDAPRSGRGLFRGRGP